MALDFYRAACIIGGITAALSVVMSLRLIAQHLSNWKQPKRQKLIIYIILMVPLFAVDSFVGLIDIEAGEVTVMVLDSIKECYEAWVLMSFLNLMYAYLNVEFGSVPDELKGRHLHHTFPFNYFMKDYNLDLATVRTLHLWTQQFIILRPIISILSVALDLQGSYDTFATVFNIVLNISVTLAVYALMMFYHAFADELSPHRPLAQFLCIKGVVFFAFWQGVVLSLLVKFGVIHAGLWYSTDEIDEAIQNFLVCLEMGLLFSFAHNHAFSAEEYQPGYKYVAPPKKPNQEGEHGKHH